MASYGCIVKILWRPISMVIPDEDEGCRHRLGVGNGAEHVMSRKMTFMRRIARSIVFLSCGYAAACGGNDAVISMTDPLPEVPQPQIVSVSPDPMIEGQTAVLSGSNFSANTASNTVTIDDVSLLVTAASTTSLTVTLPKGCGPLRIASLKVTVGGVASSVFPATVAPDPNGDAIQEVALSIGEQVVYRQPRYCFTLPTDGGNAQYLLGIQSTGRNGDVTTGVTVQGLTSVATVPPPPVVSSAAASDALAGYRQLRGDLGASPASRLIRRHREAHVALMADLIRPVQDPAVRLGAFSPQRAPSRTVVDGSEVVGDQVDLRVRRSGGDCTAANTSIVTAELKVKTARSMWWVDVNNPPGGFLDTDLQEVGTLFDDVIWGGDVDEFGPVNDIDGNGRIVILITQVINAADSASGGAVLGFVNPCDFFSRGDSTGLFASNEGEFHYTRAPDPTGAVGEEFDASTLLELLPVVLAHEFAHIIQFSRRLASATADLMDLFVIEGQATLAEEVVGHAVLGFATGQDLDVRVAFDADSTQVYPWYAGAWVDLVFYFGWPGERDIPRVEGTPQECTWIDDEVEHPCGGRPLWYGVTWSFLRWASDLYGPALGGEPAFQAALIDGDLSGFANLEEALASQGTLEDHLARWAAALYMDGRPGASTENSMSSWDLLSFYDGFVDTAWLHPVEYGFTDFTETVTIRDPSTAYFLVGGSGASSHTLRVSAPSGGELGSNVQVWLVRTQ